MVRAGVDEVQSSVHMQNRQGCFSSQLVTDFKARTLSLDASVGRCRAR